MSEPRGQTGRLELGEILLRTTRLEAEQLELARQRQLESRERLADMGLLLEQVYDETEYITSAIDLVQQSLMVGGALAIVVLLLYLRSASSTLVPSRSM